MAILPKLKSLKVLKVYKDYDNPAVSMNLYKFFLKALTLSNTNGIKLRKFEFGHGIGTNTSSQDFLYSYFKQMPDL